MQLTELTPSTSHSAQTSLESTDWSKAFNTSILSTVLDSKGRESELEGLVRSPEFEAILNAAQLLATREGIGAEVATERLIKAFRAIDLCWNKILIKKGAETLLGI